MEQKENKALLRKMVFLRPTTNFCKRLGQHINIARRRRGYTQSSVADRAAISLSTYKRIEQGDGNVSLSSVVKVLFILDGLHSFDKLLDPSEDQIGLDLIDENLPKRVRMRKPTSRGF